MLSNQERLKQFYQKKLEERKKEYLKRLGELKAKKGGPNGVPNFGSTCFMNAAYQAISAVCGKYFTKKRFVDDLGLVEESKNPLMVEFAKHFASLVIVIENNPEKWNVYNSNYYGRKLYSQFYPRFEKARMFLDRRQHDSHQFLVLLIELLSSSLAYEVKRWVVKKHDFKKGMSAEEKKQLTHSEQESNNSWKKEFKNRFSWIADHFYGQFQSILKCSRENCKGFSERFDCFSSITVPVKGKKTLKQCLVDYFSAYQLDSKNMWRCSTCHTKNQAFNKHLIWRTPTVLIIHLRRFEMSRLGHYTKVENPIDYPITDLDIFPYSRDVDSNFIYYDLKAVVLHHGSMAGGHYTTVRKVGKKWYHFDDASVKLVTKEDIVCPEAYYLVYKRS